MTKKQKDIEARLERLNQEREAVQVRLSKRLAKRREIVDELTELQVGEILGDRVNGRMEEIRVELAEMDIFDQDDKRLLDGMRQKEGPIIRMMQTLKLDAFEEEYKGLAPAVSDIADQYMVLRKQVETVVKDYNKKYRKVSQLHVRIAELRRIVGREPLDCDDLLDYKKLYWTDSKVNITLEHIKGERPW